MAWSLISYGAFCSYFVKSGVFGFEIVWDVFEVLIIDFSTLLGIAVRKEGISGMVLLNVLKIRGRRLFEFRFDFIIVDVKKLIEFLLSHQSLFVPIGTSLVRFFVERQALKNWTIFSLWNSLWYKRIKTRTTICSFSFSRIMVLWSFMLWYFGRLCIF